MNFKTKTITLFIATLILLVLSGPQVHALEDIEHNHDVAEVIINNNNFEGRATGWANFVVNNVDESLTNNIRISVILDETQEEMILTLYKINNYKDTVKIPLGNYTLAIAMAENDNVSKYPISVGDKFTISNDASTYIGMQMQSTATLATTDRDTTEQVEQKNEWKEEVAELDAQKNAEDEKKSATVKIIGTVVATLVIASAGAAVYFYKTHKLDY